MKTGAKIAIGCLAALVVACLVSALALIFAGAWVKQKAGDFIGGAFEVGVESQALERLNREHAFSAPADGAVREGRLLAYLEICSEIRPSFERLESLGGTMEDAEDPSFSDIGRMAGDVADLTGEFLRTLRESLEREQMSPGEFQFISRAMLEAGRAEAEEDPSVVRSCRTMIQSLEAELGSPSLSPEERAEREEEIRRWTERLEAAEAGGGNPNAALFRKYRDRIEDLDLESLANFSFAPNIAR